LSPVTSKKGGRGPPTIHNNQGEEDLLGVKKGWDVTGNSKERNSQWKSIIEAGGRKSKERFLKLAREGA